MSYTNAEAIKALERRNIMLRIEIHKGHDVAFYQREIAAAEARIEKLKAEDVTERHITMKGESA